MTLNRRLVVERQWRMVQVARFLLYGNAVLLLWEYIVLPVHTTMTHGAPWLDDVKMVLCVIDIVSLYAVMRGATRGVVAIGVTSAIMFALPLLPMGGGYGLFGGIAFFVLYFWDYALLTWLVKSCARASAEANGDSGSGEQEN